MRKTAIIIAIQMLISPILLAQVPLERDDRKIPADSERTGRQDRENPLNSDRDSRIREKIGPASNQINEVAAPTPAVTLQNGEQGVSTQPTTSSGQIAGSVTLSWEDPDNPPGSVRAYRIFEKIGPVYREVAEVAAPTRTVTLQNVGVGAHTYVATAVGQMPSSESNYSAKLSLVIGQPQLSAEVSEAGWRKPGVMFVELTLTNNGPGDGWNIDCGSYLFKTLLGTGDVSLISSQLLPIENIGVGDSAIIHFQYHVPDTVIAFSITEVGTVEDAAGTHYSFALTQGVVAQEIDLGIPDPY